MRRPEGRNSRPDRTVVSVPVLRARRFGPVVRTDALAVEEPSEIRVGFHGDGRPARTLAAISAAW